MQVHQMSNKNKKDEKGYTLIEMIVVISILAILGAVVVPQFTTISAKARLSADLTSIKTVQQQIDIYSIDKGTYPGGSVSNNMNINDKVVKALCDSHYLEEKYLTQEKLVFQTKPSACKFDSTLNHYVLVVSKDVYDILQTDDSNKDIWVIKENTHGLTID